MDWNVMEGKWKQLKGKGRGEWGDLTDGDLEQVGGSKARLVGKLQERCGYAKDDAERRVDDWGSRQG